jgi:hypothetical protein
MSIKNIKILLFSKFYYQKDIKSLKDDIELFGQIIKIGKGMFKKNRENSFIDSYLILANKVMIDINSCHLLWQRGYYGSAFCLLESLRRSVTMMSALYLKPELIEDYLDEENNQYNEDKIFRNNFAEGNLKKVINDKFGNPEAGNKQYADLSKATHGGSAGARTFYGMISRDKNAGKIATLTYSPFVEIEKADGIIETMKAVALDMAGIFLEKYQEEAAARKLLKKYKKFLKKNDNSFSEKELLRRYKEKIHNYNLKN